MHRPRVGRRYSRGPVRRDARERSLNPGNRRPDSNKDSSQRIAPTCPGPDRSRSRHSKDIVWKNCRNRGTRDRPRSGRKKHKRVGKPRDVGLLQVARGTSVLTLNGFNTTSQFCAPLGRPRLVYRFTLRINRDRHRHIVHFEFVYRLHT